MSDVDQKDVKREEKFGVTEFRLKSTYCFQRLCSKTVSTVGKLFTILMLEEMYRMGYEFIISSDLARDDQLATLFFSKNSVEKNTQYEKTVVCCNETLTQIKLCGNPWESVTGEENVQCKKMLLQIFGRLGAKQFRLLTSTNIKGSIDTFFFIQDANYNITPEDL